MSKTTLFLSLILAFFTSQTCLSHSLCDASDVLEGDTSRVIDLDEVVVVAQPKEAYRLRQQPVSSSMFTNSQMDALNARDLRNLSAYIPSFVMPNYGSRLTSSVYVRGIGSRVNSPSIGMYVDGVPLISKTAFNFHTYQLERIDVLRGPQGTLYGQNTEGGLVRMYSMNPLTHHGINVRLGLATRGFREVEASQFIHLGPQSALSIAGFYQGQDGFFRNTTLGTHADKMNEAGGKLRFVTALGKAWQLDFTSDYQFSHENAFPYGIYSDGKTAAPAGNRQSTYRRNMLTSALSLSTKNRLFNFYSTSSYQYLRDFMLMDQDYLPQDLMQLEQRQHQHAVTQEFVFKGNNLGHWHWTAGAFGSYQWLKTNAPVSFFDEFNDFMGQNIRNGLINSMIPAFMQARGMTYEEAKAFLEQMVQVSQVTMSDVPGLFRTLRMNLGIFHESNFDITDRLVATLGLRYDFSREQISYASSASMYADMTVMRQRVQSTIATALNGRSHHTFNQLLPKFGLRYTLDKEGSNLYATVAKGYRAGGFNIQLFSDILQNELRSHAADARTGQDVTIEHTADDYANVNTSILYKPEESWNYELGAHLNLPGNRLQVDISTFFMQIKNQQLSVMADNFGYGRMMVNAGKSQSCGLELALRGQAFGSRMNWSAAYAFTHAVFKDYTDQEVVGGETVEVDYKDKHVPFVPAHMFALAADCNLLSAAQTGNFRRLSVGMDLTGQGRTYWDEGNQYSQKFYLQLGANIQAQFKNHSVRLWGRNLTNSRFNTFAVQSAASGTPLCFAQQGNRLQLGVDVQLHF